MYMLGLFSNKCIAIILIKINKTENGVVFLALEISYNLHHNIWGRDEARSQMLGLKEVDLERNLWEELKTK